MHTYSISLEFHAKVTVAKNKYAARLMAAHHDGCQDVEYETKRNWRLTFQIAPVGQVDVHARVRLIIICYCETAGDICTTYMDAIAKILCFLETNCPNTNWTESPSVCTIIISLSMWCDVRKSDDYCTFWSHTYLLTFKVLFHPHDGSYAAVDNLA